MTPEHWLNIATQGLAPQSAERVRAEYLAHLEDALEAGEMQAAVLAEWGDPHRANRELKKAHLTSADAERLPAGYTPTWSGFAMAVGENLVLLCVLAGLSILGLSLGHLEPTFFALLALALFTTALRWAALAHLTLPPRMRTLLYWLLTPLTMCALGPLLLFVWHGALLAELQELVERGPRGLFILGLLAHHFYRLYASLRAARKVEAQVT